MLEDEKGSIHSDGAEPGEIEDDEDDGRDQDDDQDRETQMENFDENEESDEEGEIIRKSLSLTGYLFKSLVFFATPI